MPAVETIAVAGIGWFVAPLVKQLIDWVSSGLLKKYKWHKSLEEKLERLVMHLEDIQRIARANPHSFLRNDAHAGTENLWSLEDAIHDAEELLDKFHYEILNERNVTESKNLKALEKELDSLLEDLAYLCPSVRQHLHHQVNKRPFSRPTTASQPKKDKLFGYDKEYKDLVSSLKSGAGVVAIIGHGGMGKTELARLAFHDPTLDFGIRIWACVYGMFSATELLAKIWDSIPTSAMPRDMRYGPPHELTRLQDDVAKILRPYRRYLLVLDDVCNDESASSDRIRSNTWANVLVPFKQPDTSKGSRILVTTRARICAETLGAPARIILKGIHTSAIERLLKKTAYGDENAIVRQHLRQAFDDIIAQLHGSPLAAVEKGYKLKGERRATFVDEGAISVQANNFNEVKNEGHNTGVFATHLSSYQDLTAHLQRCLAFCSIFQPKRRFEREKLIKMWIALGFIETRSKSTEEVARGYFDSLLDRSLLQEIDGSPCDYEIDEHIHSMLSLIAPEYYLRIDSNRDPKMSIPFSVRHLSVTTSCLTQIQKCPKRLKRLRTLLVFDDGTSSSSASTLLTIIARDVPSLRVLDLSCMSISLVPESIDTLVHLRYLGLPNTITRLGTQVTNLLLLQTLGIKKCKLRELPAGMNRLINVRHLDLCLECIAKIDGISKLTKVQGSVEFITSNQRTGHRMSELGTLNSLCRTLSVKGLETVTSMKDAKSALLHHKEHLQSLKLEWGLEQEAHGSCSADDVLEGLQPHTNLQKLHITRYHGMKLPKWLKQLQQLRSLCLNNCSKLDDIALMDLGTWLSSMMVLEIKGPNYVKRINGRATFESLTTLVLEDMTSLVAWDASADQLHGGACLSPELKDLKIVNCPLLYSLQGLQYCRRSLRSLYVKRCPALTQTFTRSDFPSLHDRKVIILECPGLKFKGASPPRQTQQGPPRYSRHDPYHRNTQQGPHHQTQQHGPHRQTHQSGRHPQTRQGGPHHQTQRHAPHHQTQHPQTQQGDYRNTQHGPRDNRQQGPYRNTQHSPPRQTQGGDFSCGLLMFFILFVVVALLCPKSKH